MKPTAFMNLFLWFSNTDPIIFQTARTSAKWNRIGLSLFVLITGVFAFITSSFFVRTMFASYNEVTKTIETSSLGWIVSVFVGFIWMLFIVNLDRMIIGSKSKWMSLLRIPLAIAIGLIVAIPFEIQLFSGKINKSLLEASRMENSQHENRYMNAVSEIENEIKQLKATIQNEKNEMSKWKEIMEAETVGRIKAGVTGKAGKGPAYTEAEDNFILHKTFFDQANAQLIEVQKSAGKVKSIAESEFKNNKIEQSYDFASQYHQFSELKENPKNKSLKHLADALTILFVLIEIIPALMKLMNESDTYDHLIKCQAALDQQTLIVITNKYMEEIENRKDAILSKQGEKYQPKNSFPEIGSTIQ